MGITDYYTLDDEGNPVRTDIEGFEAFMRSEKRWVAHTRDLRKDNIVISTIFLGVDHNFRDTGSPILWETIVHFDRPWHTLEQERHISREQALERHEFYVQQVRAGAYDAGILLKNALEEMDEPHSGHTAPTLAPDDRA